MYTSVYLWLHGPQIRWAKIYLLSDDVRVRKQECSSAQLNLLQVGMGNVPYVPDTFHQEGKEFLEYCFEIDPARRGKADELIGHNFIKVTSSD